MKKILVIFLTGLLMSACGPKIDPTIIYQTNEFRGERKCMIQTNQLAIHNSGSVNFQLIQEKKENDSKIEYFILITTDLFAHEFPNDAIMHLTFDNKNLRKLVAKKSDNFESSYTSYSPGYMNYSKKYGNYYTPGSFNTIHIHRHSVLFPVDKDLIEDLSKSKKVKFSIEGNLRNLEGELSPDNFLPIKNFVRQCIRGNLSPDFEKVIYDLIAIAKGKDNQKNLKESTGTSLSPAKP